MVVLVTHDASVLAAGASGCSPVTGTEASSLEQSALAVHNSINQREDSRTATFKLSIERQLTSVGQAALLLWRCLPGVDAKVAIGESYRHFNVIYPKLLSGLREQRQEIIKQLQEEGLYNGDFEKITLNFDALLDGFESGRVSPDLLYKIVQYQHNESICQSEKDERDGCLLNAVGVTGSALNKFVFATGKFIRLIASSAAFGAAHRAAAASVVLGEIFSVISLPLQCIAINRDVTRAIASREMNQQIEADKTTLSAFKDSNDRKNNLFENSDQQAAQCQVHDKALQSAQELLSRTHYYNQHIKVSAVINTVASGIGIASSVCTLSGVDLPVGLALSATGFAIGMGASIERAIYKNKESNFLGLNASESARQIVSEHPPTVAINGLEEIAHDNAVLMNRCQEMVAESKLDALIQQVFDKNRKDGTVPDAVTLRAKVEAKADKLTNRLIRGTSLLPSDLNKLKETLGEKYPVAFFEGDMDTLQAKLNDRLQQNMSDFKLQLSVDVLNKIRKESVKALLCSKDNVIKKAFRTNTGKKKKDLEEGEFKQLCIDNAPAKAICNRVYARHLIQQLRIDSKFLRHEATQSFINSVNAVMKSRAQ